MKILFYTAIILLVVASCNNIVNKSSDSSLTEIKTFFYNDKGLKSLSFPLTIDTTFILNTDTNSRITYKQVRELSANLFMDELVSELANELNDFCKIDSLKHAGKYNDYIKKLDIGMTKKSIAYSVGSLKFDIGNALFIWGITNSSYEACPVFYGTKLMATYIHENKIVTTFLIGEVSGFSDPPSTSKNLISSKILNNGKTEINTFLIRDDLDISGNEITKTNYNLLVENGKVLVIDSKKEIKNTEKTGYE